MSLFTLRGIRKSFGSRLILDGLDLNVEDGARIGIVGGNGSGKTTLMRIMAGEEEADAGEATRRRGLMLALLPQHPLGDARTARKLIGLAACIVQDPGLLLLDEPEAHLDLAARQQLERLVQGFEGAVVIVSHDRYLLDETVTQIATLERGKLRVWPGNYSAYAVAREIELMRQQQAYVTQQKEIERLEDAIRRFKDWAHRVVDERHIKQARNKQRQIDRMEKIERPVLERRRIGLQLRPQQRGGQRAFDLREISVAFDETPILLGARTCSSWTSRPTTSISTRSRPSNRRSGHSPVPRSSSATTDTSSIEWPIGSSRSATATFIRTPAAIPTGKSDMLRPHAEVTRVDV